MSRLTPKTLAAPLATLLLAAFIAGCPNNTNQPPTATPKPTRAPSESADPSTNPTPSSTPSGGGANPTPTPTNNATSLPSGTPTPANGGSATPTPATGGSATPTPATGGSATPTPSGSATPTPTPTPAGASEYVQVERLGRPAINEGLIRDGALNTLWNSVGPDVDATSAASGIASHATETLKAFNNTQEQVDVLFKQLLPDVMRIDTTKESGYATPKNGAALGNLSPTNKIPIGGRLLEDDVVDITLILIVPGGLPAGTAVAGLESDNVDYDDNHKPILTEFPYLAAPN